MGLRYTLYILLVLVWSQSDASSIRNRRQLQPDSQSYQPPLLLPALPQQNSYQPPLGRSVDSSIRQLESIAPAAAAAATSYSVHQQPSYSEASGLQQNSADTHSKAISHVHFQSIHKAPASEIQAEKMSPAKEKDNKNDEYVVYYYYYYDNDTTPNNNLSLNFDDIPSLEGYDDDKNVKEPQKSASARTLATNINSVLPIAEEQKIPSDYSGSQPRSASGNNKDAVFKPDRKEEGFEDTVAQPLKPVSNVFRYAANEVPRFPILPNFIVSEVQTTTSANVELTPQTFDHAVAPQVNSNSQYPNLNRDEEEDDDLNNVLDSASSIRVSEDKAEEEDITTTIIPTTEPPTTTEIITTTTTEKSSRRRPSLGGGRRRFNQSPSSFSSNRARGTPTRGSTSSTTSTTSTSTTTSTPPTRRSFQSSNRVRPRPSFNSNRGRSGSRTASTSDTLSASSSESTTTTTQSSTTAKSRFTSSSRRFQSSRSRSQSSSTSTTTRSPNSPSPSRSRPTSRRPNLISRSRPGRPGFPRSRPGNEIETTETTTPEPEETSPSLSNENVSPDVSNESVSESEETSEEPTTTEASRFSALFRPRNRNALGNRPRPAVGNRPSRS